MAKRRSDSQLTKDDYEAQMNGNYSFSANNASENLEATDPSKMADSTIMMNRKIKPLKKVRGRGGAAGGSSRGGGPSLPNFFATTPTGGFGAGGTSQPDGGVGAFSGFGTPGATSTAPSFGGNTTGSGFSFGGNNNAPEQSKVNPFGSLVPTSSTTNGGGVFGSQLQPGSLFGGSPAPQSASTGGIFGSNTNNGSASPALVSSGFTFGGTNSSVTAPQPAATGFSKPPVFNFGVNSTTSPMFGGSDTKSAASAPFAFGANNDSTPAVTPPVTTSFTFGGSTATAPAANTGGCFGTPSPALENTSEPQTTPAVAAPAFSFGAATPTQQPPTGSSLFGKPADSQGKSLFMKPAEPQRLSLFGKPAESQGSPFRHPSPSPEPTSTSLFAPPKPASSPEPTANGLFGISAPAPAPVTPSFFNQPKEQEQNKPLLSGFGDNKPETPKQEVPKSLFGGFGDSNPETPKQQFFGGFGTPTTEKKDEPSKSLFGFGPMTENKQEEPAKVASKAQPSFSFGTPTVEKKDDDVMDENPSPPKSPIVLDQLTNNTNSFSGFGSPKVTATPSNQFAPPPMFGPTTNSMAAASNARTPSPPLPSDATSWSTAQLNEYYNLFALRALNHSFLEGLKKADLMGDWSPACGIYIKESEKIKVCQENGERYKRAGAESRQGTGIHGKRSNSYFDDNKIQGGGGKRYKGNSEDPKPSGSDSSKALASIIGSSTDAHKLASKPTYGFAPPTASSSFTSGPELASAPPFGFNPPPVVTEKKDEKKGGSIFDSPSTPVNNSGFVNPFQSHTPDPSEKDQDDEDDEDDEPSPAPTAAGSLFDRIPEPKKDTTSPKSISIFSNSVKSSSSSGLFSSKLDQTWSPDNGVRFGETNGTNGSIFGPKSDAPKSLFGSPVSSGATTPGVSGSSSIFGAPAPKSEVGFSFGGNGITKPSGPISVPDSSAVATPDGDSSEPNDNAHLAKNELDLSAQGPGEEDEDSQFQIRAIVYELVPGSEPKKAGVGTLRVLKNRITGKARVVTRTESGKVVLNVGLMKEVAYGVGDKGGKMVSVIEFLPEGKSKRYTLRVKEEEDAKKLGEVMDVAKLS